MIESELFKGHSKLRLEVRGLIVGFWKNVPTRSLFQFSSRVVERSVEYSIPVGGEPPPASCHGVLQWLSAEAHSVKI